MTDRDTRDRPATKLGINGDRDDTPEEWALPPDEQANLLHLLIDRAAPTPELEVARMKAERVFGPNP
jgi:hypothetical protein